MKLTGNAHQKTRAKTFIGNREDQETSVSKLIKNVLCLLLALLLTQFKKLRSVDDGTPYEWCHCIIRNRINADGLNQGQCITAYGVWRRSEERIFIKALKYGPVGKCRYITLVLKR